MKNLIRLVIVIALGGTAFYFKALKPLPVPSHLVSHGAIVQEALGSGSIESRRMVGVGFEVTARVAQILVDQGDAVKAGQELARLDDRTFQAEVHSARKELELAESTLTRLRADIARAQAILEGARAGLRRTIPLVEAGTSSEERLDTAREREQVAVAELARAEAALAEGQASSSVVQGRLDRAQVELSRTILLSPFDGTVVLREREEGDVAVPGSPVLRLAATDTIWSSVWVDETHLDTLRVGLPARVLLRSDPDNALRGRVARVGREVDRETRELLVDVSFDKAPNQLVFGQRVDLWIELTRAENAIRVPASLLVRLEGKEGVFVEEAGQARFQPVEIGHSGRGFLEVKSGLDVGQAVLEPVMGKRKLKEGDKVQSTPAKPEGSAQ